MNSSSTAAGGDSQPQQEPREPYVQYGWQGDWLIALVVLGGCLALLTVYASRLNTLYYTEQAPFFDSVAYNNYLAAVSGTTREQGLGEGLRFATRNATVVLPGIEVAVAEWLGVMHPRPSRHMGIWMQSFWLGLTLISIYFYWFGFRNRGAWVSLLFTLPFAMFAGIFQYNGGLSDFRMDLSLYIFCALTLTWYLITYEVDGWLPWLIAGIAAALACLSRATAPVYLGGMIGPLLLARVPAASGPGERLRLLKHIAIMLAPALVVAGAFYAYNFDYLYYYYVLWNADANAKLPVRESSFHVLLAGRHLGPALAYASTGFGLAVIAENRRMARTLPELFAAIDWKMLYIGWAPVLFLVFRGAGLNPFVSMPAVFGWLMFCYAPLRGSAPVLRTPLTVLGMASVMLACGWNAANGPSAHISFQYPRIAAIKQGIDLMRADSAKRGLRQVNFISLHLGDYQASCIRNVILYEYGFEAVGHELRAPDGVIWGSRHENRFNPAVRLVWDQEIPGDNDDAKIGSLLAMARADLDYIFLPDEATTTHFERNGAYNFINTRLRAVRKRFLESGEWEQLGGPLTITRDETVLLYAKRRQ